MKPAPGFAGSHSSAWPLWPQSRTLPVGSRCMCTATTGVGNAVPHFPLAGAAGPKVAEIVRSLMTLYRQVPVPLQGVPHPLNTNPAEGVAVSVSAVYAGYLAEQPVVAGVPLVILQLIAGVSPACVVTVPVPTPGVPPEIATVKGPLRNRAWTVRSADMV